MRNDAMFSVLRTFVLALVITVALSACSGHSTKTSALQPAADVPAAFELTLLADKDGQFDMGGATLSEEDVKGNLRYRKDQGQPVQTVLLKRNEKQKVTDRHINELARIAVEMNLRAFIQEKDGGEISEIRVTSK